MLELSQRNEREQQKGKSNIGDNYEKITTIAIIGLTLTGCAASQISLTASAPKGKDLDITIKTKEQKAE